VLAVPGPHPPVRRSGAREGDVVAVTGALGGSLEANGQGRHLTFTPRVAEALELSNLIGERLHAMIDISDGLGGDLAHLLFPLDEAQEDARSLRIVIDEEAIPCSPGATIEAALSDGEDYELLLAAEGPLPSALCGGTPLSVIGRVEAGTPGVFLRSVNGTLTDVRSKGWQHGS
jgi:thiamine-monophosphate kinase